MDEIDFIAIPPCYSQNSATHVYESEEVLVGREHVRSDVLLQLRRVAALQDKIEHDETRRRSKRQLLTIEDDADARSGD
jgi:hypothetical protein